MISAADFSDLFPRMVERKPFRVHCTKTGQLTRNCIARWEDDGGRVRNWSSANRLPANKGAHTGVQKNGLQMIEFLSPTMPVLLMYAAIAAVSNASKKAAGTGKHNPWLDWWASCVR